ncbi:hypothetical protein SUGI_0605590 [Cryptomeria japonica]|uniref:uncharacterized protein LOC131063481 n=1 Tax=Cryptomeria japonica TaxID=3369 RepID=UPI002414B85B|nr:uncharacterized protein LOC131063481 [Cryptomeria japonica]GLJ30582.1 hypothetical protein SUGI_0605590 [Cryptomeria japonica]
MESSKWEGSLEIPVAAHLERVWEIGSDFFGIKRWYSMLEICEWVEGTPEQGPGSMRYCASSPPEGLVWAKEKLISLDSSTHSFTYQITEGNFLGMKGYQGTFRVVEDQEQQGKCLVKWNFEVEPVQGYNQQDFMAIIISFIRGITKTLEEVASASLE